MATAENEEQAMPQAGWLGRTWEKVATVLAVIGLADLSGQLIKWAAAIHWIITKYAIVRAWLFGWLPFHIPPEWHDPIVLFIILFSVTNVGVYRSTQHTFVFHFFKEMSKFSGIARSQNRFVVLISTIFTLIVSYGLIYILKDYIPSPFYWSLVSPSLSLPVIIAVPLAIIAWRWLLATAAIFGALVVVNQVYVLCLEQLVEH